MSFKRDRDDKYALDNQRKQRVAELLYEDIEEEEVTRLSNGKFKCKLCSRQPIFDTINMFYVHKQGKKHQLSMEYADQQKQELADLIKKRKHEHLTATNQSAIKQTEEDAVATETISRTTLGVKKPRRPYDRKHVLDFGNSISTSTTGEKSTVSVATTLGIELPGNRIGSVLKSNEKSTGTAKSRTLIMQEKQPSSNNQSSHTKKFNITYRNLPVSRNFNDETVVGTRDVHKLLKQPSVEQSNKFYLSRKKQQSEISGVVGKKETVFNDSNPKTSTLLPSQTWEFYKDFKGKVPFQIKTPGRHVSKFSSTSDQSKDKEIKEENVEQLNSTEGKKGPEKMERAERFLNAFGSGWKRDWTGLWVKDEDAEFDSDEEPPDIS